MGFQPSHVNRILVSFPDEESGGCAYVRFCLASALQSPSFCQGEKFAPKFMRDVRILLGGRRLLPELR